MDSILQVMTALVVSMLTVVLIIKGLIRKDFSVLGEVLGAAFMVFIILYDVIWKINNSMIIHLGVFIFITSIFLTHLGYLITGKFKIANTLPFEVIASLKALKDKYDFIVEHAIIGMFVIDGDGYFEFANKSLLKMTGYKEEELLLLKIYDLIEDKDNLLEEKKRTNLITKSGEKIEVFIDCINTVNGHPTKTGSIIPVGL